MFKEDNKLRYDFNKYSKLDEEERKKKHIELIEEAISRLKDRNEHITQTSVSKEMEVNRAIFAKYEEYHGLVERHKTGLGGFNIDTLKERVKNAIKEVEGTDRGINYTSIEEVLNVTSMTLSSKGEIREIVEKQRKGYLPGQKVKRSEVVEIIEDLKKTNTRLSKRKVLQQLYCDWPKIKQQPKLAKLIENEVVTHNESLERDFQKKIKMSVDDLIESNKDISFREVARRVDIDVHGLLDNEERKFIIEKGIQEQEMRRKNLIKQTCANLIRENKRVSFIEVHRRTGLSRSKIEEKFRSIIEDMKRSQSVKWS